MAKGDKYIGLKKYLQSSITPIVTLSFNDIEQIIGDKLPKSAYDHTHSQSIAWIDSGYETDYVTDTYKDEKIIFVKR